jgi:hypothetical protein
MSGNATVAVYEKDTLTVVNDDLVPLFLKRTWDFVPLVESRAL